MKRSVLFGGQLGMSMLTIAIPQFVENLRKNIQGVETTEELLIRTLIAVGALWCCFCYEISFPGNTYRHWQDLLPPQTPGAIAD